MTDKSYYKFAKLLNPPCNLNLLWQT